MKNIVLIESSDFEGYPTGGSGSFSTQLMNCYGDKIALVGITTCKDDEVGKWCKKIFNNIEYDYFPTRYVNKLNNKKTFIPARLTWYLSLRKFKKDIIKKGYRNFFTQSPDTFLAIYKWNLANICYRFAGITNPLSMSRYKWIRYFNQLYELVFIPKLKYSNCILATAGKSEIDELSNFLQKKGIQINVHQFTTRVDVKLFHPTNSKTELHKELNINDTNMIIITSGRLSEVKGWQLLLDSFCIFNKRHPESYFIFIGDGEERDNIEKYIAKLGLNDNIKLVGNKTKEELVKYLNIADLYVMGSFFEGWPTSMIEAIVCGIPICTTNFGSAKEIVHSEKIGFIVENRSALEFSNKMERAIQIKYNEFVYSIEIDKYSTENLKKDLLKVWQLK